MEVSLQDYGQYRADLFNKSGLAFTAGKRILDLGCGGGEDSEVFKNYFLLEVDAVDIYENPKILTRGVNFTKAGIFDLPLRDEYDYVFLHDVLHHLDEVNQSKNVHCAAMNVLKKLVRKGGSIVIIEGNRFNPIFYPHMVKMEGHEHFSFDYFHDLIKESFPRHQFHCEYKNFECHLYPFWLKFWRIYEFFMENFIPRRFLAYNMVTITRI